VTLAHWENISKYSPKNQKVIFEMLLQEKVVQEAGIASQAVFCLN
jgi:hypothetical protein